MAEMDFNNLKAQMKVAFEYDDSMNEEYSVKKINPIRNIIRRMMKVSFDGSDDSIMELSKTKKQHRTNKVPKLNEDPILIVGNFTKIIVNWPFRIDIENSVSTFYGILTNNHVLPKSELKEGNSIHLLSENGIFENGNSEKDVTIERHRYVFTSKELDATFISVIPSEFHTSFKWLEVSKNDCKKGQYIFIIQHPNGGPQKIAYGSDIRHLVSTKPGWSGSPLLDSDGLVIGLNKAESVNLAYNMMHMNHLYIIL